jgi:CheY-like chemotaxis protein/HPt (histidine-containing phosphotransfer) domain-containing protein
VETTEGGSQGLELLRAAAQRGEPFDVAILDLMMPEMDGFEVARRIKADGAISAVHLVMLTSVGLPKEIDELRRLGIQVYLSKPVRQSHLYDSLMTVMSASSEESQRHSTSDADHPGDDVRFQGRVLLVEDNRINQEVARDMIEILGCRVDVANDGREALAALARDSFDLVFMDCQMPEMDGYAAARAIRERESEGNGNGAHLAIVALTAHAMDGDREKCLAAGMDDYLTKPFQLDALIGMLGRWLPASSEASAPSRGNGPETGAQVGDSAVEEISTGADDDGRPAAVAPKPAGSPIDAKTLDNLRALERQGAEGVVNKAIGYYLEDSPKLLETLDQAVSVASPAELQGAAHSLKSISANLGALKLAALCKELEALGRADSVDGAEALLAQAHHEYEKVRGALAAECEE